MDQSINDILKTIDKAISGFQDAVPGIQKIIYDELQPLIKEIEIKNGKILNNINNLKLIGMLKNKLEKVIISAEYKKSVEDFIQSFTDVSNLQQDYFKQFNQKFKPRETLPILKELTIESTINDLLGQGLNANVTAPIQEILRQNITTGGSYADFNQQLRDHILTNDTGDGSLQRYTKQITTDAINQYNAQYQDAIAQDLQFNWGRYIGSLITTSREFCDYLTKKEWVHKTELPEIIKGHINDHDCKLSKTTGLPYGMIPGTNPDNFKVRRGGYNCGHQFFWVPDSAVPEDIKRNLQNKINPPKATPKTDAKQIDLSKVKQIKDISSVEEIFKQNAQVINSFFNNTEFKSLSITKKVGVNGLTDMNGNIGLSKPKANYVIDALKNIKNNVELTPDQEKGIATLWHEIWHNTNKANSTRLTNNERRYMELGNEFVSRKTLDNFFEVLGGKLKDTTLKTNRNDTGYNSWVRNYDKLIAYFKADENIVLEYMKDRMTNGDYTDVKVYLKEAIIKGVQFSKVKTSDVTKGVNDAISFPESWFNEKYK